MADGGAQCLLLVLCLVGILVASVPASASLPPFQGNDSAPEPLFAGAAPGGSDYRFPITKCRDMDGTPQADQKDTVYFDVALGFRYYDDGVTVFDPDDYDNYKRPLCFLDYDRDGTPTPGGADSSHLWAYTQPGTGQPFYYTYIQAAQFGIGDDAPLYLYINDLKNDGRGGPGANCGMALFKNNDARFFNFGNGYLGIEDWYNDAVGAGDTLQITIIPFFSASDNCQSGGDAVFVTESSISVFASPNAYYAGQYEKDKQDGTIHLCDVSDATQWSTDNLPWCLTYPYWTYEDANDGSGAYVVYRGTLNNALDQLPDNSILKIYIPEGWDVNIPINNVVARFKVEAGSEQGCKDFVILNGGNPKAAGNCFISYLDRPAGSETDYDKAGDQIKGGVTTAITSSKIVVYGLGRIQGYEQLNNDLTNYYDGFYNNIPRGSDSLFNQIEYANFLLYTSLLTISSNYPNTDCENGGDSFAIDVSGVTVAWGAARNIAAIQLNSIFTPAVLSPDAGGFNFDLNNVCVKMFDVKVLGNWLGQADAADVGGQYSLIKDSYFHSADDSLKVEANNQYFYSTTILQGQGGAAVSVGAYGKNRGVKDSVVEGVWVHRILHGNSQCGGPQDFQNAVVSTAGCPLITNTEQKLTLGLQGATVKDVWVASAVNTVGKPFSLGVDANGGFCYIDFYPVTDQNNPYTISNINIQNVQIYAEVGCPTYIYDIPNQGLPYVSWDTTSITFDDVVIYKDDNGSFGYFPCGCYGIDEYGNGGATMPPVLCGSSYIPQNTQLLSDGTTEPNCWNTCGKGGGGNCEVPQTNIAFNPCDSTGYCNTIQGIIFKYA